jgi:hypothetical protein
MLKLHRSEATLEYEAMRDALVEGTSAQFNVQRLRSILTLVFTEWRLSAVVDTSNRRGSMIEGRLLAKVKHEAELKALRDVRDLNADHAAERFHFQYFIMLVQKCLTEWRISSSLSKSPAHVADRHREALEMQIKKLQVKLRMQGPGADAVVISQTSDIRMQQAAEMLLAASELSVLQYYFAGWRAFATRTIVRNKFQTSYHTWWGEYSALRKETARRVAENLRAERLASFLRALLAQWLHRVAKLGMKRRRSLEIAGLKAQSLASLDAMAGKVAIRMHYTHYALLLRTCTQKWRVRMRQEIAQRRFEEMMGLARKEMAGKQLLAANRLRARFDLAALQRGMLAWRSGARQVRLGKRHESEIEAVHRTYGEQLKALALRVTEKFGAWSFHLSSRECFSAWERLSRIGKVSRQRDATLATERAEHAKEISKVQGQQEGQLHRKNRALDAYLQSRNELEPLHVSFGRWRTHWRATRAQKKGRWESGIEDVVRRLDRTKHYALVRLDRMIDVSFYNRVVPLCFSVWLTNLQHRHFDLLEAQLVGKQEGHEVELSYVASRIRSAKLLREVIHAWSTRLPSGELLISASRLTNWVAFQARAQEIVGRIRESFLYEYFKFCFRVWAGQEGAWTGDAGVGLGVRITKLRLADEHLRLLSVPTLRHCVREWSMSIAEAKRTGQPTLEEFHAQAMMVDKLRDDVTTLRAEIAMCEQEADSAVRHAGLVSLRASNMLFARRLKLDRERCFQQWAHHSRGGEPADGLQADALEIEADALPPDTGDFLGSTGRGALSPDRLHLVAGVPRHNRSIRNF